MFPQQSTEIPSNREQGRTSSVPQRRPRRSLEAISIWALVGTLALAIIAVIPTSSVLFSEVKIFVLAAGVLVTLALYILARLSRGNIIFPPLLLVGALWLPALAYLFSSAFSGVSFGNAFWGVTLGPDTLGFMLIAAFFGTLAALIVRRPEQYRLVFHFGAWVYGVVVAFQLVTLILGQFIASIQPTFSLLGSFQNLAFFLGLGITGTLISLRFISFSRRQYGILAAISVVALFLLAVANVAIVWILLGIISLGLFVESIMQRRPRAVGADFDDLGAIGGEEAPVEEGEAGRSLVVPLIVLAVSLFFIIGGTLGGALANALHVNILSVSPSWQSTLSTARSTYASSPIFGSGPGTFGVDWLKYRSASLNTSVFWNMDFSSGIGFIPTSFVTTGLIGAFAWLAFFVALAIFGLRTVLLRASQDPFIRYVSLLSFIAALYLFTLAIFGLPNVVILALAFIFAGIFASTMRYAARGRQWGIIFSRVPRLGFIVVFALTILLLASVVAAYALVEHGISIVTLAQASDAYSANNLDAADQLVQESISFAPSATAYQLQANIASTRLNGIIASTTMSKTAAQTAFQNTLSSGVNAALTATGLDASDYQGWLALGNLYAQAVPLKVSGAYDNAKTAYDKAAALNPTNPQIPYTIAQLDIANKDNASAEKDLKAAIALKQDYTAAIFLLSQLEVQDGNVKDALSSALSAAYFTPNNPSILFQVGILYAAQKEYANAVTALSDAVQANPQYANARYFLSAVYAKQGDMKNALAQMQAIADLSATNAKAVATQLDELKAGKNPFPADLLTLSSTPVNSSTSSTPVKQ